MYSSNFNLFFFHYDHTAIYNSLTGRFLILRGVVTKEQFEHLVENMNNSQMQTIDILCEKGFVHNDKIGKESEIAQYHNFYIICNNTIFYHLEDGVAVVSVPGMGGTVILDKKATDIYINLHSNCHTVASAEEEVRYLVDYYPDVPLFQLVEDYSMEKKLKFANRYIVGFRKVPFNISDFSENVHSLYLKLTDYCNLNCAMCGQANYKKCIDVGQKGHRLNIFDTIRFVEADLDKIQYVYLWGGEPFLHPNWEEFASYFASNKCYVSIATNGTLLAKNAKKIIDAHVDELVVSLDGTKDVHNKIRGDHSAYSKLLTGIKSISAAKKSRYMKPKIIVNCTITEDNIYVLSDVANICRENSIDEVVFQLPMWMSYCTGNEYNMICQQFFGMESKSWKGFVQKFDLDIEHLAEFIDDCKLNYPEYVRLFNSCINSKDDLYRYFTTEDSVAKHKQCNVITNTICVEADGDLIICPDFPDVKFGNIASMTYSDCIHQSERIRYIEIFRELGGFTICKRCCHYF